MREIVVYAWNVLDEMIDQIDDANGAWERIGQYLALRARNRSPIKLRVCDTADWTLVEYNHDESQLCIRPEIANDCMSKKSLGTDAGANMESCTPSYGDMELRGVVEKNWEIHRGQQLDRLGSGASSRVVAFDLPKEEAAGYAPIIVSMIAHQLVHAFQKVNHRANPMDQWPQNHAALFEEEQGVLVQALVYSQLCQLGYCALDYRMEHKEFFTNVTQGSDGRVNNAKARDQYSYPNVCRGRDNIFLGPFCWNMLNIGYVIQRDRDADLARLLAYFYSTGPIVKKPERIRLGGGEAQDFSLPVVWKTFTKEIPTPPQKAGPLKRPPPKAIPGKSLGSDKKSQSAKKIIEKKTKKKINKKSSNKKRGGK